MCFVFLWQKLWKKRGFCEFWSVCTGSETFQPMRAQADDASAYAKNCVPVPAYAFCVFVAKTVKKEGLLWVLERLHRPCGDIFLAIAIFGYPWILYFNSRVLSVAFFSKSRVLLKANPNALESWEVRVRVKIKFGQFGSQKKLCETFGYPHHKYVGF